MCACVCWCTGARTPQHTATAAQKPSETHGRSNKICSMQKYCDGMEPTLPDTGMTFGKCQLVSRVGKHKGYIHDAHNGSQIIMRHIKAITYIINLFSSGYSVTSLLCTDQLIQIIIIFLYVPHWHIRAVYQVSDFVFETNNDRTKWMDWHGTNGWMWENDGQHEAQVTGTAEWKEDTHIDIDRTWVTPTLQATTWLFHQFGRLFFFFFFAAKAFSSRLNR